MSILPAANPSPPQSIFEDCTVASVAPLRIQRDSATTVLPFTPDTIVDAESLSIGDRVRVEFAGARTIIVGREDGLGLGAVTDTATPSSTVKRDASARTNMAAGVNASHVAVVGQLPNPNKFPNPMWRINQDGVTSGVSLALGQYFLDQLRSTAPANAVTWTGDDYTGRVLTIPAGKTVASPQERADYPAGTYTISWGGVAGTTSLGRFYKDGTAAPALAASPITVTSDGLANMIAEWGEGTLSWVKIEAGSVATPFVPGPRSEELRRCQRYYIRYVAAGAYTVFGWGAASGAATGNAVIVLPTEMRALPTVTFGTLAYQSNFGTPQAVTAISVDAGSLRHYLSLSISVASGLTTNAPARLLTNNSVNGFLALNARL